MGKKTVRVTEGPDRPVRKKRAGFFVAKPDFRKYWWGMPSFEQGNATPRHSITINLMTHEDVDAFAKATGLSVTTKTKAVWYPNRPKSTGYVWDGPKESTRYPICIPSKGRATNATTGRVLDQMGVDYHYFVEETEGDAYCEAFGEDRVIVMPFHDLGQGSIPARNFIWEWALERECKRHWTVDDNIMHFARLTNNARVQVKTSSLFTAMEDFTDRYENVAMAGPHDRKFIFDQTGSLRPVIWNTRVYSCILLDTQLATRWRGRYNEDTDLSLRLLKKGHCIALFRALLMSKAVTAGGQNGQSMKGGNTDTVYAGDDHRKAFAESLARQHPDVVKVVWKYSRWHHQVNYKPFERNTPILRDDITPTGEPNDYGMFLTHQEKE